MTEKTSIPLAHRQGMTITQVRQSIKGNSGNLDTVIRSYGCAN